jgi:hypothetical protein
MRYKNYRRAFGQITETVKSNGSWTKWTGVVGGGSGPLNSLSHFDETQPNTWAALHDASLNDRSLVAAKLKIKQKKVDLGVAFAERNRTAMLLGDTAKRIGTAFKLLKRGDARAAMRVLRVSNADKRLRGNSIPQKWLELQYGWKPLLSDVFGAVEALSKLPPSDWRVTATAQKNSNRSVERTYTGVGGSRCAVTIEDGAFTRIDALPHNDLTMSLSSLGITNPLLIAWELTPASFIVDWALPVGAWLDSLDALAGYSDITSSTSAFVRAQWVDRGLSNSSSTRTWSSDWVGTQRVIELKRSTQTGVPFGLPRFKDPRSLGHMANGLALLTQAFRPR